MVVMAELGAVSIAMPMFKSLTPGKKHLYFIDSNTAETSLITFKFVQANPESPFFVTDYHCIEQDIEFHFRSLNISLHQEGLMELKKFAEDIQKELNTLQQGAKKRVEEAVETNVRKISRQLSASSVSLAAMSQQTHRASAKRKNTGKSSSVVEGNELQHRVIKMHLESTIGSLAVAVGTQSAVDTLIAIENIRVDTKMTVETMNVVATLRTVKMEDMTVGALYKKLLSVTGEKEMLRVEMTQYQRTDEQKKHMLPKDVDMIVKVRLAEMRFVFLNLWLCRLMAWMAPFQEQAARAAAAAQAVASEKAVEAAENVKQIMVESPPRIQLDVELEAPVILLPQLSTSPKVLVFVLGKLIIGNHITDYHNNQKLIMDYMKVKLMDMKFGISHVSNDATSLQEVCEILEPLSFNIDVHRNLVYAAIKDLPEITVNAQIPSLSVNMSDYDYEILMQTLSGNLTEGNDLVVVPPTIQSDEADGMVESRAKRAIEPTETNKSEKKKAITPVDASPTAAKLPVADVPKPRIVFQFSLDKIAAILYSDMSESKPVREASNAFGALKLCELKLSGSIKDNNSMDVAMSLNTFTMSDERRDKTKIHELLNRKDPNDTRRFLSLKFSQDAEQNKNIKLRMSAFFICLCPEFLGSLMRFFTVTKTQEQIDHEMESLGSSGAAQKVDSPQTSAPGSDSGVGSTAIDCDLQGVEVILVENSLRPETSQALILLFDMRMRASPSSTEQIMSGGVEKLAIFSSYYAPERRHEVTYEVLKPMSIGIEMRTSTATKATNLLLKMSPMEIRMSPSIIRLLSSVNTEFAQSSAMSQEESSTVDSKPRSFPEYWLPKPINQKKFWFFHTPVAEEACEVEELNEKTGDSNEIARISEQATVQLERINFTLEAGEGSIPVPLVFMQILVTAEASNWSSALHASAHLSLQMSYYNEALSVWEPVIEPVEDARGEWIPWNLKMTVKGSNKLDPSDTQPAMDVKIEADNILNLTVTKSFISLLNNTSEKFAQAAKQFTPPVTRQLPGLSPFIVLNETGIIIKVAGSDSLQVGDTQEEVEAEHGRFIDLNLSKETSAIVADSQDKERLSSTQVELSADLQLNLLDTVRQLKIGRAGKVAIPLPKKSDGGYQWKIIAETSIENGRRLITFTSHVHVTNHLDVSMELYSKNNSNLDLFGTVAPGETLQLAVPLLFSATGEIFFRPANDKCEVSFESITWHQFTHNKRQTIRCDLSEDTTQGYFFEAVVLEEKVRQGIDQFTEMFSVHLYPPLQFHNILPFPITFEIPVAMDIEAGESIQLNLITNQRLRLWASYLGQMYYLDMIVPQDKEDLQVVALNTDTGSAELLLGIHWSTQYGDLKAYLYAPFWLVNNTSMILKHMECDGSFLKNRMHCVPCVKANTPVQGTEFAVEHRPDDNPLILPFPCSDFTRKKKSRVLVEHATSWSEEFPLDTVGNPARLTVNIKLCQSGLTKIVTFCPFYLVSNLGKWDMQVKEYGKDEWIDVPAEKCVGIWPQQRSKRKLLCARFSGQEDESLFFPITENFESLCQIANDHIGVEACVSTSDSSVAIHLTPFKHGMAPVCVMNNLKIPVTFGQKGHRMQTVNSNEMMYFTWSSVVEDRIFVFTVGSYTGEDLLNQNRIADLQIDQNVRKFVYLANFLIGRQRFILFTKDLDIARSAYGSWETDTVNMQVELALQGVGLSLVDNSIGKELLYIGISSSDILWEEEVRKGRFKPFTVKYMQALEEKYQEYLVEPNNEYQQIQQYEVSFANMIMKKKKGKEVKIRRIFEKGIWANYGTSSERTRLHLKVNHLQVDNQLGTCVFPRVLTNIPPPKSVVVDNAPKPFIELSLLQRKSEYSSITEIEYARALMQEFAVQIDQGLINAIMGLFASEMKKEPYGKQMFVSDMEMAQVRLEDTAMQYRSNQPKSFYNDLHISPLMIHLSFSQGGTAGKDGSAPIMPIQSEFFKVLFQSIGVSITELQDVVFKLAYFERTRVFYGSDQLNAEIISHYTMQALRQMYVLVLGLDIIGNPFGLVRDLSAGVEDLFYQPFQGLIQGPEEFATGVALGVQSMFGHAVGGAAGAVGRITGTVGKGVAALTFDQEYQRKRQEDLNRRPQSVGEGMARGVKGLGTGVVSGITGIVTKPIEGAKQEGGIGFVKGIGKGLIGAVTRPVSGVVDFASSTMHTVRTVAGADKEAGALRPPRVILSDHIVRPFSFHEAIGFKIFNDIDRGELAETDNFITYAQITDKIVLLVTNMQLVLAKRTDLVGTWATEWKAEYLDIKEPVILEDGIKIVYKQKKRGFLGFGSSEGKIITFPNAEAIQQKVLTAYRAATQLPEHM
ncbi:hypothetical protein KIN20_007693 [Parelaphostrongylus tenuis]|uniref:Uncharacterized protein n=1 Tax=Parelaphostrongylus tenuis TaxID=148309 RepID=A0AAD5M6W6_PARTN|nr:hypothetical protein KIN20_007693 [Parelaphostrongylus tenuis]